MNRLSWLVVAMMGASACGGGGDNKAGTARIGAAGGTVKSADGRVELTIPAGALASPIDVRIAATADTGDSLPGTSYAIDAPSIDLTRAATLRFGNAVPDPIVITQALPTVWIECHAWMFKCAYVFKGTVECPPDHPVFVEMSQNLVNDGELYICSLDHPAPPQIHIQGLDITSFIDGNSVITDIAKLGPLVASLIPDVQDPTITLTSTKETVGPNDNFALIATVSDNNTVASVEFFGMTATVVGSGDDAVVTLEFASLGIVQESPFALPITYASATTGAHQYAAIATDASGNLSDAATTTVTVDPNITSSGPSVILGASADTVSVAGDVVFTASVTASSGVTKVELFEGGNKLGESTTSPYTFVVSYTAANNGAHTYFARATDAAGLTGNSNNVGVEVQIGVSQTFDYYVNPQGGSDLADGLTEGTAFATLCKVRQVVTGGERVGLMDGVYDAAAVGACTLVFQVEVSFVAVHQGAAILEARVSMNGGGDVDGLLIRKGAGDVGGFNFTAGTVNLSHLTFGDISSQTNAKKAPLVFSSSTVAVWNAGSTDVLTVDNPNSYGFSLIFLTSNASLTVNGGVFNDSPAGNADTYCNELIAQSGGTLDLNGVTANHKGTFLSVNGATASIRGNSVLHNNSTAPNLRCFDVVDYIGAEPLTLDNVTLSGGHTGLAAQMNGADDAVVTIGNGTAFGTFLDYGIDANVGGVMTMNISDTTITTGATGMRLRGKHLLTMRNSHVVGNVVGIEVTGNQAISIVDLGDVGDLGGNFFNNNSTTGVKVAWSTSSAGAEPVLATGNTWNTTQGATAGHYADDGTVIVGPASGTNYTLPNATSAIQL